MAKTVYLVYKNTTGVIAGTITDNEYAELIANGWTETTPEEQAAQAEILNVEEAPAG